MIKRILVYPNRVGLRFDDMKFKEVLEPGVHWIFAPFKRINVPILFTGKSTEVISSQAINTSENLEVKVSYFVEYSISDPEKYVQSYDAFSSQLLYVVKQDIHLQSQIVLRDIVSKMALSDVLISRDKISEQMKKNLAEVFAEKGIQIDAAVLRDIGIKSDLRNVYSEEYMIEKKANLALASARSQVASARAMANASKILEDNKNIKFLKLLETLEKVSEKSGNTIHIHVGKEE